MYRKPHTTRSKHIHNAFEQFLYIFWNISSCCSPPPHQNKPQLMGLAGPRDHEHRPGCSPYLLQWITTALVAGRPALPVQASARPKCVQDTRMLKTATKFRFVAQKSVYIVSRHDCRIYQVGAVANTVGFLVHAIHAVHSRYIALTQRLSLSRCPSAQVLVKPSDQQ